MTWNKEGLGNFQDPLGSSNEIPFLGPQKVPDLKLISGADWAEGLKRLEILKPILVAEDEESLQQRGRETGIGVTTLRRWRKRYLDSGEDLVSLIKKRRSGPDPESRLDPRAELILHEVIEEEYLGHRQTTPRDVISKVRNRCAAAVLPKPSDATIYRRLKDLHPAKVTRIKRGKREWEQAFKPLTGEAFKGLCPLDLVEADHALLDILILDDDRKTVLGRPWATFFLDIYSRCLVSMVLCLEKPGLGELGVAITLAVLPKDSLVARLGLDYPWPCQGLFQTLHLDNAMEFQSLEFQRALERYHIDVQYRCAGHPETGPHIERFIKEIQRMLHRLPGTTERSPEVRGEYKPAMHAVMTFDDLNNYLFTWVLGTYHQRPHSSLEGKTPLEKWEEGINGTATSPGLGEPALPEDPHRFYIDFLPSTERQVQREGIRLYNIWYQADVLQGFIGLKSPDNSRGELKLLVRYDPMDLSRIFVVHPLTSNYMTIPYRDLSHGPITLRQLRCLRKIIRQRHQCPATEALLFREQERQRALVESAQRTTKKARRMRTREQRVFSQTAPHRPPVDLNSTEAQENPPVQEGCEAPTNLQTLEPIPPTPEATPVMPAPATLWSADVDHLEID